MKKQKKQNKQADPIDPNEHVLHMWAPFHLRLGAGYDYLSRSVFYRVLYAFLRTLAVVVFSAFNPLVFGFRIRGRENLKGLRGGITLCNHVHPLDCTMVGVAIGVRRQYFMTLQSNLEIPVIRHLVKGLGGIPIPRERRCLHEFSEAVKEALRTEKIVHIYPEGVLRPYWEGLRPFRAGAFSFAYDCHVPLIPMVILYRKPMGLRALFRKKPLLELRILPPVYPNAARQKAEEVSRLLDTCRTAMQNAIDGNAG